MTVLGPVPSDEEDGPPDDLDDLAAHPELLAELLGAEAAGVSWRRFTGWEPVVTTTLEYDDDGRLIRLVATTEPEWNDEQRAAVYALQRYKAGLCPGCEQPLSETTKPEHEFAYEVTPAIRCHRCTTRAIAAGAYDESSHPEALLLPIRLRPPEPEEDPDGR